MKNQSFRNKNKHGNVAQLPTRDYKKDRRNQDRIQHLLKFLPQKQKWEGFLDVGCGNAEITLAIADKLGIQKVFGIDVFDEKRFVNPSGGKTSIQIQYKQNTNNRIDFDSDSVELVTCFMAIHHFEQLDSMLKEIQRVLVLQGYLFIREHDVPKGESGLCNYITEMHQQFPDHPTDGYIKLFDRNELRSILSNYGFQHVGDSDYSNGKNPQAIYHSLFALKEKPNPQNDDNIELKEMQDEFLLSNEQLSNKNEIYSQQKDNDIQLELNQIDQSIVLDQFETEEIKHLNLFLNNEIFEQEVDKKSKQNFEIQDEIITNNQKSSIKIKDKRKLLLDLKQQKCDLKSIEGKVKWKKAIRKIKKQYSKFIPEKMLTSSKLLLKFAVQLEMMIKLFA